MSYFEWTTERINELASMKRDGFRVDEIAERLGASRAAIVKAAGRFGLAPPRKPYPRGPAIVRSPTKFQWTDHFDDRLKESLGAALSYSHVAELLTKESGRYVTRNTIAGRASRLGIHAPKSAKGSSRPKKAKLAAPRPFTFLKGPKKPPQFPRLCNEEKEYILGAECEPPKKLTILDLKFDSCRWIVTDLPKWSNHLYCGNKTVEGSSYCEWHRRKAWARTAA